MQEKYRVLIIGSGGREHAFTWKISLSNKVDKIFVAPGNAGTSQEHKTTNIDISPNDIPALIQFSKDEQINLVIVGPEDPLVNGITDQFTTEGINCFGPSSTAAQLEGSKDYSKTFMRKYEIPTADYETFDNSEAAINYINEKGAPLVVKADGLAAGKGVIVAMNVDEAVTAVKDILDKNNFGEAGTKIVIEEFLHGEEASFIVVTDGEKVLPLATSQDHKARDNGDKGPNTGGMGAYSPAPIITEDLNHRIMNEIINPTLSGLKEDGIDYLGFLYAGLMISEDGQPKILEYNCRFGDPETQPIMMRLESDFIELILATMEGSLSYEKVRWSNEVALGVVMAAGGYPIKYSSGDEIIGIDSNKSQNVKVFHAGTSIKDNQVVTSGGRVLCVVGRGKNTSSANRIAYEMVNNISWKNEYHRDDIGHRAIDRE